MSFADVPKYYEHYNFTRVEEIRGGSEDRIGKALWTEGGGEVFVTCACCGAINHLKGFYLLEHCRYTPTIFYENIVTPCINCTKCKAIFAARLCDWEKVSERTRKRFADLRHRRPEMKGGEK